MNNRTDHGFLILADVSGFTAFVTTTELEHGSEIIAALLDEVVGHLSPPLEIQEIEGDAVFALGGETSPLPKARLLEVLEGAFAAFKTRQRAMQDVETCFCGACRQIGTLDLKMVVHHGPFLRQGRTGGYALLTEPVLRSLGIDAAQARLPAHTEYYEHLGDIRCFVRDLTPPLSEGTLHPQAIA
jgi:uncharacterized protein DUF2652